MCCGTFEYSTVCDLGQCGVERYGAVKCRDMRYGRCSVVCCGVLWYDVWQRGTVLCRVM